MTSTSAAQRPEPRLVRHPEPPWRPARRRRAVVASSRNAPSALGHAQTGQTCCPGGVQTELARGAGLWARVGPDISAWGTGTISEEATAKPMSRRPDPEE